ncbi:hypothetical protein ACJMK2_022606 [Sinanodonta woodiana]|uniref:SOCS box domain-containing protein n=1 Tax=Sinanodonta woodiana TaxID=1069815 RepID=A0ABD3TLQ5_SINWO
MSVPPPAPPILDKLLLPPFPGVVYDEDDPFAEKRFQKELQFRMVGAIERNDLKLLTFLTNQDVDTNATILFVKTPLIHAIDQEEPDIHIIRHLLTSQADPNQSDTTPWKQRPIHLAVAKGLFEVVRSLLSHGTDVNGKDAGEMTALHYAARFGHDRLALYLIENGADVNTRDNCGRSAIHRAVEERHLNIVKILLEAGASVNEEDNFGWTPIFHAVMWNDVDVVRFLISCGASVNHKSKLMNTPLHTVVCRIRRENSVIVLQTCFDFYKRSRRIPSEEFKFILQNRRDTYFEILKDIINAGADLDVKNASGERPIHLSEKEIFTKYLVQAGATINLDMLLKDIFDSGQITLTGRTEQFRKWMIIEYQQQFSLIRQARKCIRSCLAMTRNIAHAVEPLPLPPALKAYLKVDDPVECV